MNHTPTPWAIEYVYGGKATMVYARIYEVGHKSQSVGFAGIYKCTTKDEAIANAQFIVRACNAHETFVKTLKEIETDCLHLMQAADVPNEKITKPYANSMLARIQAALKLARGE